MQYHELGQMSVQVSVQVHLFSYNTLICNIFNLDRCLSKYLSFKLLEIWDLRRLSNWGTASGGCPHFVRTTIEDFGLGIWEFELKL